MNRKTSSQADIPFRRKLAELSSIFRAAFTDVWMRRDSMTSKTAFLEEYRRILSQHAGKRLEECAVFEIGYGAQPLRLMILNSLGIAATGIDLDYPMLRGTSGEFRAILKNNGFERALKSLITFYAFGLLTRRRLRRHLSQMGYPLRIIPENYLVGDVARLDSAGGFDLICSEDVFEHIRPDSLDGILANMRKWLKPGGIAIVRPNVFTGITGGHLVEWWPINFGSRRKRSEPWEHLRRKRYAPNVYLNELWRSDYRALFAKHFDIVEERVMRPELGKEYLTGEIADELRVAGADELFSNRVLFVLKKKKEDTERHL